MLIVTASHNEPVEICFQSMLAGIVWILLIRHLHVTIFGPPFVCLHSFGVLGFASLLERAIHPDLEILGELEPKQIDNK